MTMTISIETDARGVATLWLDRADKHNAMSAQMIAELHEAAHNLGGDDTCRVVVLAARGKTFCAGGDLEWMRAQFKAVPAQRSTEAAKHVPRYLAEFEYRFNRRYDLAAMIPRLTSASVRTPPMPYHLLKLAEVHA